MIKLGSVTQAASSIMAQTITATSVTAPAGKVGKSSVAAVASIQTGIMSGINAISNVMSDIMQVQSHITNAVSQIAAVRNSIGSAINSIQSIGDNPLGGFNSGQLQNIVSQLSFVNSNAFPNSGALSSISTIASGVGSSLSAVSGTLTSTLGNVQNRMLALTAPFAGEIVDPNSLEQTIIGAGNTFGTVSQTLNDITETAKNLQAGNATNMGGLTSSVQGLIVLRPLAPDLLQSSINAAISSLTTALDGFMVYDTTLRSVVDISNQSSVGLLNIDVATIGEGINQAFT